jgi:hypothetical protein
MGKDEETGIVAKCSAMEVYLSFEVGRSMFIGFGKLGSRPGPVGLV